MPQAPLPFCPVPGCTVRAHGRCAAHQQVRLEDERTYQQGRRTRHQRGYTNRWAAYSKRRLAGAPWCVGYPVGCHSVPVLAEVTDHIVSREKAPERFWDPLNHQSLCRSCNGRKARVEDAW
jgi:5-methylcytosine-specific restriction enzyme A